MLSRLFHFVRQFLTTYFPYSLLLIVPIVPTPPLMFKGSANLPSLLLIVLIVPTPPFMLRGSAVLGAGTLWKGNPGGKGLGAGTLWKGNPGGKGFGNLV